MSNDILPENDEGERHGYCEEYWHTDELWYKGVMVNGGIYGYFEVYDKDGSVVKYYTGYFLNHKVSDNNKEGYCYIWCRDVVDE